MARYFMHVRNGAEELLDPEGQDFPNIESLRNAVLFSARSLFSANVLEDGVVDLRCRIDAHNDSGEIVYSLEFKDAVEIISETTSASGAYPFGEIGLPRSHEDDWTPPLGWADYWISPEPSERDRTSRQHMN